MDSTFFKKNCMFVLFFVSQLLHIRAPDGVFCYESWLCGWCDVKSDIDSFLM